MTAVGGFLPLEAARASGPAGAPPYHGRATALASGRACWHAVLRQRRPQRVLLPFYICDAVLEPLRATNTPYTFYALDRAFRPVMAHEPEPEELLLFVNYFGLQASLADTCSRDAPGRVVIDDTQAFFRRGNTRTWSFNSARKFFGVPDGGFLYGPVAGLDDLPPSDIDDCDHLVARAAGDGDAWAQYKRHEARIGIEVRAMSAVTSRLLAGVDMDGVRLVRGSNFESLHRRLGALNGIELPFDEQPDSGPMCYPFLPESDVDRAVLAGRGIYVPALWPEVAGRSAGLDEAFLWERAVARRLLPLPIDHRYGVAEMERLADAIVQVLS